MSTVPPTTEQRTKRAWDAYTTAIDAVRSDPDLTDDARRRALAQAVVRANDVLHQLRDEREQQRTDRRQQLQRRLFGAPASAAADYRDALDRANQVDSLHDAERLLDRAQLIGDDMLARAVATVAAERAWSGVLERYASTRPGIAQALNELRVQPSRTERFGEAMTYSVTPPTELAGLDADRVRRLAETP